MEATVSCILDKRRLLKKTNSYRIAIRITYDRKPISFPLSMSMTEHDFGKLALARVGKEFSQIRHLILKEEQRAKEIIKNLGTFTFTAFREEFYKEKIYHQKIRRSFVKSEEQLLKTGLPDKIGARSEGKNKKYGQRKYSRIRSEVNYNIWGPVAVAFGEYITILEHQERIGTLQLYFSTMISLLKFKQELRFEDITVSFLYQYEQWLLAKRISYTTIGMHTRNLRAIINIQIQNGLFPQSRYPFGKRKYQVPSGTNVKKALNLNEIKLLYDYTPSSGNKNESFAKDIWFFGYFCNGINIKDIASLKYKNISDGFINIIREKTKFTTRSNPKTISIPMNEDIANTIGKWGNAEKNPENFIFPIFTPNISAYRKKELVQDFTGVVNDWMKKIAVSVGLTKKVLTLTYRHTYATVLKRAGVSPLFIKEQLGHNDLKTTENYLDSFEADIKKEYSSHLMSFKNI